MKRTILYLTLMTLSVAHYSYSMSSSEAQSVDRIKSATTRDALSAAVRHAFEDAVTTTRNNLELNMPDPKRPLRVFFDTIYKTIVKSTNRSAQASLEALEQRTHNFIEASRIGMRAFEQRNPDAARAFSNTEKDTINAIYQLSQGHHEPARKLCNSIADRGRFATYNDYASQAERSIALSRAASCSACRSVFDGGHPRALAESCTKAEAAHDAEVKAGLRPAPVA